MLVRLKYQLAYNDVLRQGGEIIDMTAKEYERFKTDVELLESEDVPAIEVEVPSLDPEATGEVKTEVEEKEIQQLDNKRVKGEKTK